MEVMEATVAVPKRQWGVRRKVITRMVEAPRPFDLAPPPWVLRLFDGGLRSFVAGDSSSSVAVRDVQGYTLVTARVAGAVHLDDPAFERCAAEAYGTLASVLRTRPNRFPLRLWNHIPDIRRQGAEGVDRYMVFNAGRFAACSEWFGSPDAFDRLLPTASAVGHDGTDLVVHLLASDSAGRAIENPRQVPSYKYSRRFGPRPPCFARATSVTPPGDAHATILVGGTASIRGEDTAHVGNLLAQTRETFDNLAALVRSAGAEGLPAFEALRVYYVHDADHRCIERMVLEAFPRLADVEYVRADLCRPDLLVEIEGVARGESK